GKSGDVFEQITVEECAEAEAHDDHAAGQAAFVGEPLGDDRDGGDVPQAQSDAADDAVSEVDPPRAEFSGAEAGEDVADAPEDRAGDDDGSWAGLVLP